MADKYKSITSFNFKEIPQLKRHLSSSDIKEIEIVSKVLPFKSNSYLVNELIDWEKYYEDPIFNLTFPNKQMLIPEHFALLEKFYPFTQPNTRLNETIYSIWQQLNPHPAGQHHNIPKIGDEFLHGVQHKYRETVLFFPKHGQTCHAYCTFCFRWPQFTGMEGNVFASHELELLKIYLKNHDEVTDVLFTGGDPMTMSAKILTSYIEPLLHHDLRHIQTIRIGTKALAYWPYRFTTEKDSGELLKLFEKIVQSGRNLAIMAHFNHPIELSTQAVENAIKKIRSTGAQIRTQSPILNHINNDFRLWAEMWRRQVTLNCIPYYMFVARDTGARHYFSISLENAWNIFRNAYQSVSGVCRTVRGPSMSSTPGKIQVLGITEIQNQKFFVMRFLQGRNPEWVAKPFLAAYNPDATWLDELKPAFGESSFFFEKELEQLFDSKISHYKHEDFE